MNNMFASVRWILRITSWIVFIRSTCDALNSTQASIFDYYQDFGNSTTPNGTKYNNATNNTVVGKRNPTKSHESKPSAFMDTTVSPTPVNNGDDDYYNSNTTNEPTAAPTIYTLVHDTLSLSHTSSNSTNTTKSKPKMNSTNNTNATLIWNNSTVSSSPVFGHSFDSNGNFTNNETLVVSSLNDTIGSNSSDYYLDHSPPSHKNSTKHTNKTKSFNDTVSHSFPWTMSLDNGNTTNHNATSFGGSLNDTTITVSNSSDYLNGNFTNNETTTLGLLNTTEKNNSSEYYFGIPLDDTITEDDDRSDDDPPPEYPNTTTRPVPPHATISSPTSSSPTNSPTDNITIVPFPKFDGHENQPSIENDEEEEASYYNTNYDDDVGNTNSSMYSSTDGSNNGKLVPILFGLVLGFFIVAWELQRNPDGLCANLTYCLASVVWFLITTPILFLWRLANNRAAVRSGVYGEPEYFQEGSFQPSRSYREDRYLPRDLELS